MKLVHWPLMGGLLHLVQRGGTVQSRSPPRPFLAVPNVTAHPSTASVPTSYCCIMVCCSAVLMCAHKGLKFKKNRRRTDLRKHFFNLLRTWRQQMEQPEARNCSSKNDQHLQKSLVNVVSYHSATWDRQRIPASQRWWYRCIRVWQGR